MRFSFFPFFFETGFRPMPREDTAENTRFNEQALGFSVTGRKDSTIERHQKSSACVHACICASVMTNSAGRAGVVQFLHGFSHPMRCLTRPRLRSQYTSSLPSLQLPEAGKPFRRAHFAAKWPHRTRRLPGLGLSESVSL